MGTSEMLCRNDDFWSLAFAGEDLPWLTWAAGDLSVKLAVGVGLLLPFRLLMRRHIALPA